MFFNLDLDSVASLNIDPMLALMAMQADTPEELSLVLDDIEREQDLARAAKSYNEARNAQY